MNILSISNLTKMGREAPLFTDVTFGLNEGEKAAIIGRNGTGKSTMLSTIAGILTPDEGSVVINKESGVSFLGQNPQFNSQDTIEEHIFKSNSPKLAKIREYEELCLAMEKGFSAAQQNRFDTLTLEMDKGSLWNYESQVRSILSTLGIKDMTRKMGTLSGGMLKKVALAQVLVEDTKLLLLDEPTNHLDIETIYFLQNYLHDTKRSVLMVTHDRYFLDAVCSSIYELDRKKLKLYEGNYSTYLEKKQVELEIEQNTERRIESVLRVERDWLMRGPCARGTKAKARIQRDNALINREKFTQDKGFSFEVAGRRLGGKILELHGISKNFPKGYVGEHEALCAEENSSALNFTPVLKNFSYKFNKGEKIGIFGNNGSGKSTLLNIITGTIQPDSGTIEKGENTFIGYYQQNPVFKDLNMTVLDYIKEAAEIIHTNSGKDLSASQFLNEFGFEGKIQHSMLSTLSGGERKRVFLVRLLISNPNFLVLDEPTNDFDIFTMNILEQFLTEYQGCLLVVSHDRYFMDKVADTLFIMEDDGNVSGFVGKCSQYIDLLEEKKKTEAKKTSGPTTKTAPTAKQTAQTTADSPANTATGNTTTAQTPAPAAAAKPKRRSFKEQKEYEALEAEIFELEDKKSVLEAQMADPDFSKARKAGEEYTKVDARLNEAYERWSALAELSDY